MLLTAVAVTLLSGVDLRSGASPSTSSTDRAGRTDRTATSPKSAGAGESGAAPDAAGADDGQTTPNAAESGEGEATQGEADATGAEAGTVQRGVYLARITDLNQGSPRSTVEVSFSGPADDLRVAAVAGTGIGATTCTEGTPEPSTGGLIFMTDEVTTKGRYRGTGEFRAHDDGLTVAGRPASGDTIRGTLSMELSAGCTATIDFTAHLQPAGEESVADRVLRAGS